MPESSHKVIHPESIYDVIELIGTRALGTSMTSQGQVWRRQQCLSRARPRPVPHVG